VSILLDTNVLLRRVQPSHPGHALAVEGVARLLAAGEAVHFTLQNIAEFWNVATRPTEHNGLGFSAAVALAEVDKIEAALELLPDTPALTPRGRAWFCGTASSAPKCTTRGWSLR
jgi:predicted nucleic acid-binding protein